MVRIILAVLIIWAASEEAAETNKEDYMVKFMSGAETKCVGFIIDGKAIGCTQGCGKNFDNSFELKTEPNYVALFGTKQIAIKNNKATLVKEGTAIMAINAPAPPMKLPSVDFVMTDLSVDHPLQYIGIDNCGKIVNLPVKIADKGACNSKFLEKGYHYCATITVDSIIPCLKAECGILFDGESFAGIFVEQSAGCIHSFYFLRADVISKVYNEAKSKL